MEKTNETTIFMNTIDKWISVTFSAIYQLEYSIFKTNYMNEHIIFFEYLAVCHFEFYIFFNSQLTTSKIYNVILSCIYSVDKYFLCSF